MSYQDPPEIPIADPQVRMAISEVRRALIELARETNRMRDITVTLPLGTPVQVRHGLGRAMLGYSMSAPTGATASGRIVESNRIPQEGITLTNTGMGATVTVSLRFW